MNASAPTSRQPYDLDGAPSSSGRVLLSRAFTHYCLLHWGIDETEIPAALDGSGRRHDVDAVGGAANLLGHVFSNGGARTSARPFGGGPSIPLDPQHWELDDHRPRFLSSSLNLRQPWDHDADPTHWIFVDTDDWNQILEASCADVARPQRHQPTAAKPIAADAVPAGGEGPTVASEGRDGLRLVRMPEVKARTGLARSTIYKKVGNGTFPKPVTTGSFLAWREAAVDEWLADPR